MTLQTREFSNFSLNNSQEPGDNFNTALNLGTLNSGLTVREFVGSIDTTDLYQFTLDRTGEINLDLEGLSADADLGIFDSNDILIGLSENSDSASETLSGILDAGTYYASVVSYDGDDTDYNLNFALSNSSSATPDPGETFDTALNLGAINGNTTILESVGSSDTADFYQFEIAQPSDFSLFLDGLNGDADVKLYDRNGELLDVSQNYGTEAESFGNTIQPGTYFVSVNSYDGVETDYTLNLSTTGTSEPRDNPTAQDPGNSLDTALQLGNLNANFSAQETVGINDNVDYYEFSVSESGIFTADLSGLAADADIRLINDVNANGVIDQGEVTAWQWEIGNNSESIRSFLDSGDYFLEVGTRDNQTTNYTVETDFTAAVSDPLAFNIEIAWGQGSEGLSQGMVDGIYEAADFWENVISHSSFDSNQTLTIEVGGEVQEWGTDGGVLASAAPYTNETDLNGNIMPVYGISSINTDPNAIEALSSDLERFTRVMIHEFGHVMGIGTLWDDLIDPLTGTYNADTYAGIAYGQLSDNLAPTAIPLTTGVGSGSDLAHWREEVFGNELMTHSAEYPGESMPLSQMTIASLRDIGWNVNYGAAEYYPDSFTQQATQSLISTTDASSTITQNIIETVGIYEENTLFG
ncbi:pre-peptidase C-terminal domain-containing protein [Pleurocapsa sp. FMAR1]|uniref:pre-peptidase C-terminal domain-containing protein n=1 Tax=Pleurocapsa sp. FMAR1 TaxID=3040204 RepID=UPI0029C97A1F|nr:pre-peptidase C-terminal domain-containing protein [Pleurocapsa sp. FMAR1]